MQDQTILKSGRSAQQSSGTDPAVRVERLPVNKIISEPATQVRAVIQPAVVAQYASGMKDPAAHFPAVVVFQDGNRHILADGFHRLAAARKNGFKEILAEIRPGKQVDALRYALSANTGAGLARTYKDKRRSVALALAQWPDLSTREIARICGVSDPFVTTWRRRGQSLELEPVENLERRPRFVGHHPSAARTGGPGFERPQFEDERTEEMRLKYLAETWPATCRQCDKEFRYNKTQPEPALCPACAAETRECKLCGKPFEARPGKELCSTRCEQC